MGCRDIFNVNSLLNYAAMAFGGFIAVKFGAPPMLSVGVVLGFVARDCMDPWLKKRKSVSSSDAPQCALHPGH